MSIETLSRRYSTALADVVLASGEAEGVSQQLQQWVSLLESNPDLKFALGNPTISHAAKERVLEKLIERLQPTRILANFLRILLRNGRITLLNAIQDRFSSELEERAGIARAAILAARELTEAERAELASSLEGITGRKIKMKLEVKEDLIGGVIARIGSTVYDGSIRSRLESLKQELLK
jgi:F-type H+-transporting ATPase subunit delta